MEALPNIDYKSSQISDQAVIERVLAGEKELYEILLRRNNQTLYRTLRSYLADEEVPDVMQDTYIKAYEKLYQFKGDASFTTWLIRIGINEALQRTRKKKRSKVVQMNEDIELEDLIIQMPTPNEINPEKRAIHNEILMLVERAIDQLPEKYRVVYILRIVEGMENSEIAKCLEISESNVKVRVHRAKNLLKEELYSLSKDKTIFEFGNSRCDAITNYVMGKI